MIKAFELSKARKFNNLTNIKSLKDKRDVPFEEWPQEWKTVFYKAYPRFDQVLLPSPSTRKFNLYKSLVDRESFRDFSARKVSLEDLSDLLYYSIGMKRIFKNDSSENRMYPSAGGRYPLEVYIFALNIKNIDEGVYHYHFKTHSLECVLPGNMYDQIKEEFQPQWVKDSGFLVVMTSIFDRSEMKYKDRAYRHIFTEYGHIGQNFYLIGESLNLGVCSIGGFSDVGLNRILDIDGISESVIGVIAVGEK